MEHKTWTTIDKTGWGDGPWMTEPDKEQWADEATGYPCLLKRNRSGALCGYVGVPEGHPWHGASYWPEAAEGETLSPALLALQGVEVHGGLTYADSCQEGPEGETICHVPAPGEPEPLWWLGFDCAHAWDLCPERVMREALRGLSRFHDETYRDVAYVKAECAALAAQAAKVAA